MLLGDTEKIEALEGSPTFFHQIIKFYVSVDNGKSALVLAEQSRARTFADLLTKSDLDTGGGEIPRSDSPTSLADVVEIVRQQKNTTVEYFLTLDRLIIWVISPAGDVECIPVSLTRKHIDELVTAFLKCVQSLTLSSQERDRLSETLQELHKYLIEPIPPGLLPLSPEDVITIIPHGSLFQLPFAALKSKEGRYFIEDHTIVYSSSIDILRYTAHNKLRVVSPDAPTLLAFINPDLPAGYELATLNFTEEYFDTITAFYSGSQQCKIYKGKEATKQVFLQEAEGYTVLCLVTHSKILDDDPPNSYLVLAGSNVEGVKLKVSETLNLHIHADLVLLSGCETGIGHLTGNGVNNLSRTLTAAGAASLLVNLWSIPEQESLQQLYSFHEYWRGSGTTKAQALRQAQIESLHNYPEQPDIWAAFILIGDWV